MKLLVANRGEIARRVFRTAKRLNWTTIAIFAEPDNDAAFVNEADISVCIGGQDLADSYLNQEKILEQCRQLDVDAVHPGYGFLSENADFARAVIDNGIIWVGPNPDVISSMGSKIAARSIAASAGLPLIPGFADIAQQDDGTLAEAASEIGYPVLLKASAGGGGKGIRIVHSPGHFSESLTEARTEAMRSFGDDAIIVERYIERPRHVEVQLMGDKNGALLELGTRDCSIQRRYQKLIEEAPAPNLRPETEAGLRSAALALGRSIGYDNAGTVEFVVDVDNGDYFFLEVNTRLQVEHPVTEQVTGLDLVELQLVAATGGSLPVTQEDVTFNGHAIEVRINAEDPANNYAPQTGRVETIRIPHDQDGVRWDGAFDREGSITPHYDSMIAKLIVSAPDRNKALNDLASVLDTVLIGPLVTNTGLHRWIVSQPEIRDADMTTRFLEEHIPPNPPDSDSVSSQAIAILQNETSNRCMGPWHQLPNFRIRPDNRRLIGVFEDQSGTLQELRPETGDPKVPTTFDLKPDLLCINKDGHTLSFRPVDRSQVWIGNATTTRGALADVVAPFPAVVVEIPVTAGDSVQAGDAVLVIEAMKMLHTLSAPGTGTVAGIWVSEGGSVEAKQTLVTFEQTDQHTEEN